MPTPHDENPNEENQPQPPKSPQGNNGLEKMASSGAMGQQAQKAAETARKVRETAQTAKTIGQVASKAGAVVGKIAVFPGTWIVAAIAILLVISFAFIQVIGTNENICAQGGGQGQTAPVGDLPKNAEGLAEPENARNVLMTWLTTAQFKANGGKGMTKEQAAGILGNWSQESWLTPWVTQAKWIPYTATNAEVLAKGGSDGGKAIGLAQWDGTRRVALVKFADSQGKPWQDTQVQLDFFMKEVDSGYESILLKGKGFWKPGLTPKEYATIFEDAFERAGKPEMENRWKAADEIFQAWGGGGGTMGGSAGAAVCEGGGGFDNSSIVAMALSIALPNRELANSHGTDGQNVAPQAYKDAKKKAMEIGGKDWLPNLYASCDRFVATVIKNTVDKDIPWGNSDAQFAYLKNSSKYMQVHSKAELQPGDILATNGHIAIYIGDHNGTDTLAHASIMKRVGALTSNYLTADLRDPRQYIGFRFKG